MNTNHIRELIEKSGKNQTQISQDLGITRQRLNFYVLGKREPDNEMLKCLANYFGVSTDYLLGLDDKKEKAPALADEPTAEAFELKLYRALVSGGIIPPGGDLTDKQVEILDAIATIIDATFGD